MARVLVQRKIAKAISLAQGNAPDDDALPAGHMRLYGFYKPSLEAGLYGIEAKQVVNAKGNDTLEIYNYKGPKTTPPPLTIEPQLFSVAAPQFSIDPKLINTFYPPSGHQDEGRILPHVVFSDPHVPWLRLAGISYPWLAGPIDPDTSTSSLGRNMVPWMALMVFDADELVVQPMDATAIGLTNIASYVPSKLPGDGAFPMMVGEYLSKITKNRIYYEAAYTEPAAQNDFNALKSSTEVTSVIFPTKERVEQILGNKDRPNALQGHKLLAHVRHINTTGFPDAGVEEEGYYSVVVSSMTGRIDNTTPVTQVVHLVSIENYDSTVINSNSPFNTISDTGRVGLVSLFSWTYTAIPEASNFVETIQNLASNMQFLNPPQPVLDSLQRSVSSQATASMKVATQLLHDRLSNSYTLSRWRTSTGEQTVAFNRGPLVSVSTPDVPTTNPSSWPALSMSGKDYQIFDEDVGLMDVTYSSAWSLGRLVAISDSPFNAALLRFRSLIWQQAASNTRLAVNNISSAKSILKLLSPSISGAGAITSDSFSGAVKRLNPASTSSVAPPVSSPAVAPTFSKAIKEAVTANASMSNSDGQQIYSDFQLGSAANSDWELIHNWLSNCLYLANIPAHYLFPEPTHIKGQSVSAVSSSAPSLPPEALRFFFIDNAWLDCFIDGALSCANHLEPQYDHTRQRIKEVYNYYLSSNIYPLEGQKPPIPRSGFILRSSVVKAIPDLKVTVTARAWDGTSQWVVDPVRDPVVRITRMDDFTILCLLDCLPQEIFQVTIAQPPHQQRFALGPSLEVVNNVVVPNVEVKMLYTSIGAPKVWEKLSNQPDDQKFYYEASTRCIDPMTMAASINKSLLGANPVSSPALYDDNIPDSCVLGLELNDPSYQLTISTPAPSQNGPLPTWIRQLWIGLDKLDSVSSILKNPTALQSSSKPQSQSQSPPTVSVKKQLPLVQPQPPHSLFSSTIIPLAPRTSPQAIASTKVTSTASGTIDGAQFTVVLHPDYRPAPPTPFQSSASNVYAPLDFLPTGTNTLYDVILVVRRIKPATTTNYKLVELDIELPISDGTDAPDIHGNIREPLIPAGGYTGGGVRMTTNLRFVPTLYTAADSNKKTVLGIKLIPRSGDPNATITLTNDGRTTDASIRLAQCPIAPIVDTSKGVQVATVDAKGVGTGKSAREPRGICKIVLKEVYLMSDGTQKTVTTDGSVVSTGVPLWVLKRAGGDVDLSENAI